jgi:membrane protein YdbS with pleckstrin-like domain
MIDASNGRIDHPMPNRTEIVKLPALQLAWRVYFIVWGFLFGAGACIALGLMFGAVRDMLMPAAICGLVWAAAGAYYAQRAFNAFSATVIEGEGVIVKKGVWWCTEIMVPISRLQHIDVNQGPLDRRWDMARLSLHTAGTHDKGTRIYGMAVEQAHALRSALLPRQPLAHD